MFIVSKRCHINKRTFFQFLLLAIINTKLGQWKWFTAHCSLHKSDDLHSIPRTLVKLGEENQLYKIVLPTSISKLGHPCPIPESDIHNKIEKKHKNQGLYVFLLTSVYPLSFTYSTVFQALTKPRVMPHTGDTQAVTPYFLTEPPLPSIYLSNISLHLPLTTLTKYVRLHGSMEKVSAFLPKSGAY